jgi:hypothetical protein
MPIRNPVPQQPTPEEQHAAAKEIAKREAEERSQAKAREMQEDQDRQQGKTGKKEK